MSWRKSRTYTSFVLNSSMAELILDLAIPPRELKNSWTVALLDGAFSRSLSMLSPDFEKTERSRKARCLNLFENYKRGDESSLNNSMMAKFVFMNSTCRNYFVGEFTGVDCDLNFSFSSSFKLLNAFCIASPGKFWDMRFFFLRKRAPAAFESADFSFLRKWHHQHCQYWVRDPLFSKPKYQSGKNSVGGYLGQILQILTKYIILMTADECQEHLVTSLT